MANEYLKRTPTSTGNRKVWTWSGWVKKQGEGVLFYNAQDSAPYLAVGRFVSDGLQAVRNESATVTQLSSDAKLRDFSSWKHVCIAWNTTASTESDRTKLYINGVLQSVSGTYATINYEGGINRTNAHTIGGVLVGGSIADVFGGELTDIFFVDGQALTPDVFGFYKDGNGYISAGSTQATDFRNGQWVPRTPREIKNLINDNGGFGVNGFYLPMNDSSNVGADFHTTPNSIITLKGENLAQPRNGAPDTTDAYVSQLRSDPYAANLVLAVPGISTATGANLVTNGTFDSSLDGWTASGVQFTHTYNSVGGNTSGKLMYFATGTNTTRSIYQNVTTETGKRYTLTFDASSDTASANTVKINGTNVVTVTDNNNTAFVHHNVSFTAASTSTEIKIESTVSNRSYFDNVVVKQEDAPRDYSADIKGSGTNKTLTANGNAGVGYEIPSYYGSALSFDGNGDYFSMSDNDDFNFAAGDFTVEAWIKGATGGSNTNSVVFNQSISSATSDSAFYFGAGTNGTSLYLSTSGNSWTDNITSSVEVDNDCWNHLVWQRRGTYLELYTNGVCVGIKTNFSGTVYNSTRDVQIGVQDTAGNSDFEGYIQDLRVYKGVAKYKGGFDVPKPYTPVGIESWRAVSDTCKNNFATLNVLYRGEYNARTLTNGNLTISHSNDDAMVATVGVTTGKWYWETLPSAISATNNYYGIVGAGATSLRDLSYYYRSGSGTIVRRIDNVTTNLQSSLTNASANDVIGIAFNASDKEISWYLNGTQLGTTVTNIASATNGIPEYFPLVANENSAGGKVNNLNFGQNPTFSGNTTAGTYTDSNGKGLFKYQPPTGFLALCEDNLPTPAIKDPGEHFKTVLYTGALTTGSGTLVSGVGFQPDLIWIKNRSRGGTNGDGYSDHALFDSVRGYNGLLRSNYTGAENTSDPTNRLTGVHKDGFSVGYYYVTGYSGDNYVAWCWKAGGPAVTNTDGSITSQVSVNQDAGFSIVSYTGNGGNNVTIGHGLEKTPKLIIVKNRSITENWSVWHHSEPDKAGYFTTGAFAVDNFAAYSFNEPNSSGTYPTDSVFYVSASGRTYNSNISNGSGNNIIAYCWAEIEGYSKFGSYIGNNSADGPFVYCGFKPAFVLVKSAGSGNWVINDSSRGSTNPNGNGLLPSTADVESNVVDFDFLSNGFKLRGLSGNGSGQKYIFAAFAESPFQTANAK